MSRIAQHLIDTMRLRDARVQSEDGNTRVSASDLHLMREVNRRLVLNYIRENGPIARAEIARHTGLSRTTVGNIMDELLQEEIVHEGSSQRAVPSGGRRVIPVHFNASAGYILGVAMGRNHLTILLTDLSATVLKRSDVPFMTSLGPDICLPRLVRELRTIVDGEKIAWSKIVGIGLGMPGPLDMELKGPSLPPYMPGWDGIDVRRRLSTELTLPLYLDNNANMGAVGEINYGVGRNSSNLLYVKIGTGIGSGLIIDGKLYRGSSGSAGEIGHMTIDPNGPQCHCGKYGCLEALASKDAIIAAARHASATSRDLSEIIQAAKAGESSAQEALRQAGTYIGIALASLVNFLNPALIVIDGSPVQAGELLMRPIRDSVAGHSLASPLAHTQIFASSLDGSAMALGGVARVIEAAFGVATYSPLI